MIKRKTVVKDNANYYISINDDLEVEVNGFTDIKPVFDATNIADAISAMDYFQKGIEEGWLVNTHYYVADIEMLIEKGAI